MLGYNNAIETFPGNIVAGSKFTVRRGFEIEDAAAKVAGVNKVRVNFLSERMTLDADDARFDEIVAEIGKIIRSIEPDAVLEV